MWLKRCSCSKLERSFVCLCVKNVGLSLTSSTEIALLVKTTDPKVGCSSKSSMNQIFQNTIDYNSSNEHLNLRAAAAANEEAALLCPYFCRSPESIFFLQSPRNLKCLLTGAKVTWLQPISVTLVHMIAVDMQMMQQMVTIINN